MKKIYLYWMLLLTFSIQSQTLTLSEQAKVSVLTCGTTSELYALFGHTGIRIADPKYGIDMVYNYGAFDFNTPDFYTKFIKGDLLYFIGVDDYEDFVGNYVYDKRSVSEQFLNITPLQKQKIYEELKNSFGTEAAFYQYKFIDKNCTTLAAELIERNTNIKLNLNIPDQSLNYRTQLNAYLETHFWEQLGINLAFGFKTDTAFDHVFLPVQLMQSISSTQINKQPLTSKTLEVFKSNATQSDKNTSQLVALVFVLALLSFGSYQYPWVRTVTLVVFGLFGFFLLALGWYSHHAEVSNNYNTLLISPLFLGIAWYTVSKKYKKARLLVLICGATAVVHLLISFYVGSFKVLWPLTVFVVSLLITSYMKINRKVKYRKHKKAQ